MVSASSTGGIAVWNKNTGQFVKLINTGIVKDIKHINSDTVVTLNSQRSLTYWNTNVNQIRTVLSNQNEDLTALLVISQNEIVVGTSGARMLVLNSNGDIVKNISTGASITSLAMLQNGDIISTDTDKNIKIWSNYENDATFSRKTDPALIYNVATTSNLNQSYIIYSINSIFYVLNSSNGALVQNFVLPSQINAFKELGNGNLAISSGKTIYYYNLISGRDSKSATNVSSDILSLDRSESTLYVGTSSGDIFYLSIASKKFIKFWF